MSNLTEFKKKFVSRKSEEMALEEMTVEEYLHRAKKDSSMYASVYERLLKAIGPSTLVDTSKDERLGRIFENKIIETYPTFSDFYGLEEPIQKIVKFIKFAAQGLEEANQILYFLGPVGSAKSSLASRLKELIEQEPIYVLKDSPINESPLALFSKSDAKELGIPERYFNVRASAALRKRLEALEGDFSQMIVEKVYPSAAKQRAVGIVVAGDPQTQDISTIVGKINIRALEQFDASDPDAYSYTGGLCHGNRGIMEFIEMFKADIKILNPLLTATQEHQYQATEAIGMLPFEGLILAHSNETEWELFKNNKANEALLDRTYIIDVPYCLRIDEEVQIYKKLLRNSLLVDAPIAPGTLEMLATFAIATRVIEPFDSTIETKIHVYNGEHRKDKDPNAKALYEYKKEASAGAEGFSGMSTRTSFKVLAKVFNFDHEEIAANPVHLMQVLVGEIPEMLSSEESQTMAEDILKGLSQEYRELLNQDLQVAMLDSYHVFGQGTFDRYILLADQWLQDRDYRDPDTGQIFNRKAIEQELQKLEKPANIASPKEFRQEIVNFCLRYQTKHNGQNPDWTSYEKISEVIKKYLSTKTQELIPLISFTGHASEEEKKKQERFIDRMLERGYTAKQVRLLYEWQLRESMSPNS